MSTYLELCQRTAQESGTVSRDDQPASVVNQSRRLKWIVDFVADAAFGIDRSRRDWRYLTTEFEGTTVTDQHSYAASDLGISERFSYWIEFGPNKCNEFSLYDTAAGQSTEGFLQFVNYREFRQVLMIGAAATQTGKPGYITVTPDKKLRLHPIPNTTFTLRGQYYKTPKRLAADDDIPDMPEQFHEVIVRGALERLFKFDEDYDRATAERAAMKDILSLMLEDQLPSMEMAEPLV